MDDDVHATCADESGETMPAARPGLSRRGMLTGALWAGVGGTVLGAAAGSTAAWAATSPPGGPDDTVDLSRSYPFYGQPHQGGIDTAPQRYSMFMTFNLPDAVTRAQLQALLARWSAAAAVLQPGKPGGAGQPARDGQPGGDTGE